jgi:hypothetical protein
MMNPYGFFGKLSDGRDYKIIIFVAHQPESLTAN